MVNRIASTRSPTTARNVHAVLRRALNQAMRWGLIQRNAASLVTLPRQHRFEAPTIGPSDARAIIEAVRGDRLDALLTLTLATGLRQGEALALRWSDIDFDGGALAVRRTPVRRNGQVLFTDPKTARSRRTVALPSGLVAVLRAHKARQAEERLWGGSRWQEHGLVFTTTIGTPMTGGYVTRGFQRLLAGSGLARLRFHDLRHGTASLLLEQGIHPQVVMELLGHSTIALTMNVYSHVVPALQREAAARMEVLLSG